MDVPSLRSCERSLPNRGAHHREPGTNSVANARRGRADLYEDAGISGANWFPHPFPNSVERLPAKWRSLGNVEHLDRLLTLSANALHVGRVVRSAAAKLPH
jgi:hypothetical protein